MSIRDWFVRTVLDEEVPVSVEKANGIKATLKPEDQPEFERLYSQEFQWGKVSWAIEGNYILDSLDCLGA